ncbi:MAG: hypothetical protein ACRENP_12480 [Longimicrobiales bacterium]
MACKEPPAAEQQQATTPTNDARTPADSVHGYRSSDFEMIAWLRGYWIGTNEGGSTVYEKYEAMNDTLIRGLTYNDSSFSKASDTTLIYVAHSRVFLQHRQQRWVATVIDSADVHFLPFERADGQMQINRNSPAQWTRTKEVPTHGSRLITSFRARH